MTSPMPTFLNSIINFFHGDALAILPQMELLLFALGILIFDLFLDAKGKHRNAYLALAGVIASGLGLFMQARRYNTGRLDPNGLPGLLGFQDTVFVDGFFLTFALLFLVATALVILLSIRYMDLEREQQGAFYALILFACIGMMFMASGIDLVVLFLGLEIMALSFCILSGLLRTDRRSNEATMKYFLLGAFSTAILAYGFSLLYGMTASTNVFQIGDMLDRRLRFTFAHDFVDWFVVLAFVTVAAGVFFKIAAVPFHQWAPDVYEGSPTPVVAYLSVASITAGFALLLRLMFYAFGGSHPTWQFLIAGVAIASLIWGNLAALTQNNLKRLLAYSSISHAGYILLGLVAWDPTMENNTAVTGIFYYLMAYAFMTLGAFAIVVVMRQRGILGDTLDDLDGLYHRNATAAVLLLIFMLSLAGVPPSAGFMGKYFIFQALIETHHPLLAVLAALFTIPALYYYLRVVLHAWVRSPGEAPPPHFTNAQAVVLGVTLFVTVAAGLYPEPFTRLARYAFGQ
jgi:NADH-quinone oxidoreductase subunit N